MHTCHAWGAWYMCSGLDFCDAVSSNLLPLSITHACFNRSRLSRALINDPHTYISRGWFYMAFQDSTDVNIERCVSSQTRAGCMLESIDHFGDHIHNSRVSIMVDTKILAVLVTWKVFFFFFEIRRKAYPHTPRTHTTSPQINTLLIFLRATMYTLMWIYTCTYEEPFQR